MPTILVSRQNTASQAILRRLVDDHAFQPADPLVHDGVSYPQWSDGKLAVLEFDAPITHADFLSFLESDLFVFASTHKAESGRPALTAHSVGNWGSADLGGSPNTLGRASARAVELAFETLRDNAPDGYAVTLEATHHGPTALRAPAVFVELGSGPEQWSDGDAAGVVARAVLRACREWRTKSESKTALGIGGTHYCAKFNDREANGLAFSFIAPKHALSFVTAERLREAMEKTSERVETLVVDWKGCGAAERTRVIEAAESLGLAWERA